ncbi:hypothetical protein CN689_08660 [Peribacillus butanolivorans]|uniref:Uncharacterized protein n=1 Tax=Peribacillus butanolivorans TaxID=421767 RepID=A0AAX0S369_9BACI|nr:hypothetical protein [Peribacillus butanolivorans]PEJ34204.1 hypothetical protein CN689_08660 [Peribacillus butanolivorans]
MTDTGREIYSHRLDYIEIVAYVKEQNEKDMRMEMIITKNITVMEKMTEAVERLENLMYELMEE